MRILWLTHMLPYPPAGGSLLRTHHLLREASRFATVHVLAFLQPKLLPDGMTVDHARGALGTFCSIEGVFEIPFDTKAGKLLLACACGLTGRSYTTHWTHSRSYAAAVLRQLDRAPDLLVVDTIGLVRNVPARVRVPIVLNHHNEEISMLERRATRNPRALASRFFRYEANRLRAESRRFFPRVAKHLVTSDLDRTRLEQLAPAASTAVVPNGVDTREYPCIFRKDRAGPFTILFIGGGTWYPNREAVHWLIREIWPSVKARIPSARLVLIGRSPTQESVDAARTDERLTIPGYVNDIVPWAEKADVFVCPMKDGGGTRLKVLHAFSLGLPIVSTSLGMEGIDARSEEHYLEADTSEGFVDQIARLAANPDERERLSRDGRDLVARLYDWRVVGEVVKRTFTDVVAADVKALHATGMRY